MIIPRRKVELPLKDIAQAAFKVIFKETLNGSIISEFENKFATFIGVKHALALPSARIGLSLFLDTLTYVKGDEVILSSFNYHVIPAVFYQKGFTPIFIDSDPKTLNMDVNLLLDKISAKTKVIVATHLFGKACEIDKISQICKERKILLIEDVAHACGGEHTHKLLGNFGDVSFFSFGTGKALVTLKGGMLTTNDDKIAKRMKERLSALQKAGKKPSLFKPIVETVLTKKFLFSFFVYPVLYLLNFINSPLVDSITGDKYLLSEGQIPVKNSKFSRFQAVLGLMQLGNLEHSNNQRIAHAQLLNKLLSNIPEVIIPIISNNFEHTALYYIILVDKRTDLRNYLLQRGVDTKLSSMCACSSLSFFGSKGTCPIAETIAPKALELPCYPSLTIDEITYQANRIKEFYKNNKKGINNPSVLD